MNNVRLLFMGTPEFGLPTLTALHENYNVIGVVCQPDKPSDRGKLVYSPIKKYAVDNNIKVYQPIKFKEEYKEILKDNPELVVTCAYGQILPQEFLDYPKYGCINIHGSLLPKLRGGAPIHRAIMEGYSKTGITIMKMALKMDAGDIISQSEIPILDIDNAGTLHDKLSIVGRDLLIKTLPDIISGNITPIKQKEEEATYAWNIKREDEKIDFNKISREIVNQIRGLNPWPGAYTILGGKILKIWNAKETDNYPEDDVITGQITAIYEDGIGVKTGNGEMIITELQLEGRTKMTANEFINGVVNKDVLIGRVFE